MDASADGSNRLKALALALLRLAATFSPTWRRPEAAPETGRAEKRFRPGSHLIVTELTTR